MITLNKQKGKRAAKAARFILKKRPDPTSSTQARTGPSRGRHCGVSNRNDVVAAARYHPIGSVGRASAWASTLWPLLAMDQSRHHAFVGFAWPCALLAVVDVICAQSRQPWSTGRAVWVQLAVASALMRALTTLSSALLLTTMACVTSVVSAAGAVPIAGCTSLLSPWIGATMACMAAAGATLLATSAVTSANEMPGGRNMLK